MKIYKIIIVFLLSISSAFAQTEYSISTNPGTPSSRYTLNANTNYGIYLNVYVDSNATIKSFKTTFDGTHELTWNLTKFEKNKWVEIFHTFSTTNELENSTLKIDVIDDDVTGFGTGTFYIDDIQIYNQSSLSLEELENRVVLYPNPAKDNLTIKNISNKAEVVVYNVLGAKFNPIKRDLGNDSYSLDLKRLPSGVYFIRIKESDKTITKKIIKN